MKLEADIGEAAVSRRIFALYQAAREGDEASMKALVDIGNYLTETISFLACSLPGTPARTAADAIASKEERWPVSIPSIEEMRDGPEGPWLPESLGKALDIEVRANPKGGSPRKFDPTARTGLAKGLWDDINPMREGGFVNLPPLDLNTIDEWARFSRGWILSRWSDRWMDQYPKMKEAVEKRQQSNGGEHGAAVKYVLFSELKKGFASLAKRQKQKGGI